MPDVLLVPDMAAGNFMEVLGRAAVNDPGLVVGCETSLLASRGSGADEVPVNRIHNNINGFHWNVPNNLRATICDTRNGGEHGVLTR